MIWVVLGCMFGVGAVAGMIVGKVLTERELVDYAEERYQDGYNDGCEDGYDDGFTDAINDSGNAS